jgi:hydroxycarboxylate dehydrogenase B
MVVTQRCNHGLVRTLRLRPSKDSSRWDSVIRPGDGHFVAPWGGREGRLSTNPLSFAVPGGKYPPILGDFSTSQTPEGKLRLYLNQKKPLPQGWIVDAAGNPSNDPAALYGPPRGAILPFGGELGYRGFALGLLVEVLGGLLGGTSTVKPLPGNGLCFIVVNVSAFLPPAEFATLIEEMRDYIKSCPPVRTDGEITLPGELDFRLMRERTAHGIPVDPQTWEQICQCAESVAVKWAHVPTAP